MTLDEYLWKNKIQLNRFAEELGIHKQTALLLKHKKCMPSLINALLVFEYTKGQVTFEDMLDEEKKQTFTNFKRKMSKQKSLCSLFGD